MVIWSASVVINLSPDEACVKRTSGVLPLPETDLSYCLLMLSHLLQQYQDCHSWLRAHSLPTRILLPPAHSEPACHRTGTEARLVNLPEPG